MALGLTLDSRSRGLAMAITMASYSSLCPLAPQHSSPPPARTFQPISGPQGFVTSVMSFNLSEPQPQRGP